MSDLHPCQCVFAPGERMAWCPRHKLKKTRHWVHLCQTHAGYRRAWDEGKGPGQNLPRGKPMYLTEPKPGAFGPGMQLRKLLGCTAKGWPHYRQMNEWGDECLQHSEELAASLVEHGYVPSMAQAERLINIATTTWTNT